VYMETRQHINQPESNKQSKNSSRYQSNTSRDSEDSNDLYGDYEEFDPKKSYSSPTVYTGEKVGKQEVSHPDLRYE
jgi:hypothetical protein